MFTAMSQALPSTVCIAATAFGLYIIGAAHIQSPSSGLEQSQVALSKVACVMQFNDDIVEDVDDIALRPPISVCRTRSCDSFPAVTALTPSAPN